MISEKRVDEILKALGNDQLRIKRLAEMGVESASAKLRREGYDISASELVEFGEYFRRLAELPVNGSDELSEQQLEDISGRVCAADILSRFSDI